MNKKELLTQDYEQTIIIITCSIVIVGHLLLGVTKLNTPKPGRLVRHLMVGPGSVLACSICGLDINVKVSQHWGRMHPILTYEQYVQYEGG